MNKLTTVKGISKKIVTKQKIQRVSLFHELLNIENQKEIIFPKLSFIMTDK